MSRVRTCLIAVTVIFGFFANVESALARVCEWTGNAVTNGAPDNRWSLPANWSNCGGRAPGTTQEEDNLIFPDGAKQPATFNDLPENVRFAGVSVNGTGRNAANARVA